jgi:hypothetical protein
VSTPLPTRLVQAATNAIGALYGDTEPGHQMTMEAHVAVVAVLHELVTEAEGLNPYGDHPEQEKLSAVLLSWAADEIESPVWRPSRDRSP